jgi:hypothetical protein
MSDLHYQAMAEYLLEDGTEIVIGSATVLGKKRFLGYEESRELGLMPGSESYRLTVPKSEMVWVPARGLKVKVDGQRFTVGTTRDLVTCYRFVISRNSK